MRGRQLLIVMGFKEGCKQISACLAVCICATTDTCARLVCTGTAVHVQLVTTIMLIWLKLLIQVRQTRRLLTAGIFQIYR